MFDLLRRQLGSDDPGLRYLRALDWKVEQLKERIDADRGLIVRGEPSPDQMAFGATYQGDVEIVEPLPHESNPRYWESDGEDRDRLTPDLAKYIYTLNAGRDGTSHVCEAAFCFSQPQSKHFGDQQLLAYIANAIRYHVGSIRPDGLMGTLGLNGYRWAHGWDIEGLVYAIVHCREHLDPALIEQAMVAFNRAAGRMTTLPDDVPAGIGSFGNQRCVWILSLYLYGKLLDRPELIEQAEPYWRDAMPNVLDENGQVVEQHGPCMHYSFTAFIYAWLNLALRGGDGELPRVLNCLKWFQRRFTRSLYPIAGPSAREFYELPHVAVMDILPAAEQVAHLDPSVRDFVKVAARKYLSTLDDPSHPAHEDIYRIGGAHAGSILMWCALFAQPDVGDAAIVEEVPTIINYRSTRLHPRSPMLYMQIRQRYQTHFSFTDFLPFAGIQTWAWGDEPPIIHPTPMYPSTTMTYGIDTARQGASHNWAMYGAGAMGIDGYAHAPDNENDLWVAVARYHLLWRVVCFTPCSTVILELGPTEARQTRWTLNRFEPAAAQLAAHQVSFKDRAGCLHCSLADVPQIVAAHEDDAWARGVQQLVYDCGTEPTAFALSNDSFRFETQPLDGRLLRFADESGRYEVTLEKRFFEPNPAQMRVDTFQMACGTMAQRLS